MIFHMRWACSTGFGPFRTHSRGASSPQGKDVTRWPRDHWPAWWSEKIRLKDMVWVVFMLKLVTSVRLDQVTTCSSSLGDSIQSILLANWCWKSVHGNEELSILFHTYKALHSNLLLWKAFMKESLGFQQIQASSITWLSALQVKVALKACNSCPVPHGHCGSPWGQPRDCVK